MLLDITNITAFRENTKVFDGFTLQIEKGCSTAILGPNGAGKSTLLKLVSGELHPLFSHDSHIRIFGKEHWNVWDLRSHLGIISYDIQHDYLSSALGVNVILSGLYSSIDTWAHQVFSDKDHRRADEIMRFLGISDLKKRAFGSMSTGEQRRFLLGRALIHDPTALLFDEPTSGLDVKASFLYREIFRELIQSGKTVLLITHHVQEIPPEVHRVVLLKNGRIFADGSKEDILTSEKLSSLFDYPVRVIAYNGTFQVFPAAEHRATLR